MSIDEAFTKLPTLSSNRLSLREVQDTDAEEFFKIKSNRELTERYGGRTHSSIEETLQWIERIREGYKNRESLFWCVTLKQQDAAIGSCLFWHIDESSKCAELGYELHPDFWQKGIMAEAVATILQCGFRELGFNRVEACPFAGNIPSNKLLLRLGFVQEGNLRQRCLVNDRFEDQLYFGLLREEWAKLQA
ncbi:MAG: GNAT family N-acetyltransferase [Verrucomicrobia bacterium]|nr:GNAT family N-acetyltransferase [Verrucomicrobiota bacterium]